MLRLLIILTAVGLLSWGLVTVINRTNEQPVTNAPSLPDIQFTEASTKITTSITTSTESAAPTTPNSQPSNSKQTFMPSTSPTAPAMMIDENKRYQATLHTNAGDIVIELNAKATPKTVNNFVVLAQSEFYNNTIFHRVIKGFMIQGGDPKGDGTGGPGYRFDDEPFRGEYTRGVVAMANAGPNTNGSQFFIMHAAVALEKNYVIFGQVIKGLDVVDAIANAPVTSAHGEMSRPISPVTVTTVTIAAS